MSLGDSVLDALNGLFAFGFTASQFDDGQHESTGQKHAVREFLKFFVDLLNLLFASNGTAEQGFQDRQ